MIRYSYDKPNVEVEICQEDRNWLEKAASRTQELIQNGEYGESSSIWSVVKPVFMRLQKCKCIYCERRFETPEYGTIEWDLEHFRPKGEAHSWPDPYRHPKVDYDYSTGVVLASGYYWLAYDLRNYAASCKVCNSRFKATYFPIAGQPGKAPATVAELLNELPLLCYPIGEDDDDPEELISFNATSAVPTQTSGLKYHRGRTIIDFFGLNEREVLHQERASWICIFGAALSAISNGTDEDVDHELVDQMGSDAVPHASCLRAFRRLWNSDVGEGKQVYAACRRYLARNSQGPPLNLFGR